MSRRFARAPSGLRAYPDGVAGPGSAEIVEAGVAGAGPRNGRSSIAAIETNMGDAWRETAVAVITEFGRTARINGTDGTDHGTGTVAFLAGGALKGGRVIADWPGLKNADLLESGSLSRQRPTIVSMSRSSDGASERKRGAGVAAA